MFHALIKYLLIYLLTYLGLFARWSMGHRPFFLHSGLFVAIFSISLPGHPIFLLSFVVSLCQVFLGLPLLHLPWWFHVSACRVMFLAGSLSVYPIHLHVVFVISCSTGSCLVLSHSVVLGTLSDHFRCKILRRHLLLKISWSAPAKSFYKASHVDNPALSIEAITHFIAINRTNKRSDHSLEDRWTK